MLGDCVLAKIKFLDTGIIVEMELKQARTLVWNGKAEWFELNDEERIRNSQLDLIMRRKIKDGKN